MAVHGNGVKEREASKTETVQFLLQVKIYYVCSQLDTYSFFTALYRAGVAYFTLSRPLLTAHTGV